MRISQLFLRYQIAEVSYFTDLFTDWGEVIFGDLFFIVRRRMLGMTGPVEVKSEDTHI